VSGSLQHRPGQHRPPWGKAALAELGVRVHEVGSAGMAQPCARAEQGAPCQLQVQVSRFRFLPRRHARDRRRQEFSTHVSRSWMLEYSGVAAPEQVPSKRTASRQGSAASQGGTARRRDWPRVAGGAAPRAHLASRKHCHAGSRKWAALHDSLTLPAQRYHTTSNQHRAAAARFTSVPLSGRQRPHPEP